MSISGNFRSGQDVLAFTNTSATLYGNISASYNASTGVLTLTSSGATATLAQWQAALRAVTYLDTAAEPDVPPRTVSFSVNDGVAGSATATKTLDVFSPPIVTTSGGTTNYAAGTAATVVDSGVTVTDPSRGTQASGTITIGAGFHSGDTLSFTNISASLYGNISASYNSGTGVLTLTSSGASATDAQWADALTAVHVRYECNGRPPHRFLHCQRRYGQQPPRHQDRRRIGGAGPFTIRAAAPVSPP